MQTAHGLFVADVLDWMSRTRRRGEKGEEREEGSGAGNVETPPCPSKEDERRTSSGGFAGDAYDSRHERRGVATIWRSR